MRCPALPRAPPLAAPSPSPAPVPAPPQELKALTTVLDSSPPPFCLELAALAARREYLNLDKWLGEQFSAKGA